MLPFLFLKSVEKLPKYCYGKYRNNLIKVFPSKRDNHLLIATRNNLTAEKLEMRKIGVNWFNTEVLDTELGLIWEEVTQVKYSKNLYGEITELGNIWKTKITI